MLFAHIKIVFAEHNSKSLRTSYFIPGVWLSHSSAWQLCKWAINSGGGAEIVARRHWNRWFFPVSEACAHSEVNKGGVAWLLCYRFMSGQKGSRSSSSTSSWEQWCVQQAWMELHGVFTAHISRQCSSTPIIRQTKFKTTIIMIFT